MIQVINQNDPIPARILPPSPPVQTDQTVQTVQTVETVETVQTVQTIQTVQPIPTDQAVPLRVSGIISWITVLVLCLFTAVN